MADRPSTFSRLAAPLKGFVQRFTYLFLVLAAFALMLVGKVDAVVVDRARSHVLDAVAPILSALATPVATVSDGINNLRDLADIRAENARLKAENARLRQWQTVARSLASENKELTGLLQVVPEPAIRYRTARVIADTGSSFAHTLVLAAGRADGVRKGQAVIGADGFVGRIVDVGARASRVLLITDINSRIPVVIGPERTRAVMAGDNTDRPRLIHLPQGVRVSPGARVVTSGHGGAFPPGLPVGVVAAVTDAGVEVEPFMHRERLEYVRAVEFGLSGILGSHPPGPIIRPGP